MFSWCSKMLAFLALKNKLISFPNRFKPSFPNLLTPTKKCKHLQQLSLIVIPSVKWCTHEKHKKDKAKFKNASKSMHFQILPHLFFLYHHCLMFFIMSHVFYYAHVLYKHKVLTLVFYTSQITLFCSHSIPIKFPRDSHKAQTQSSRCFQQITLLSHVL